jgi:hypothetical protein
VDERGAFEGVRSVGDHRPPRSGRHGVVYEAFDGQRRERVALKALRQFDASALYRFKHEFRTLADVLHPNLVSLHELVADDNAGVFFTMDDLPSVGGGGSVVVCFAYFGQVSRGKARVFSTNDLGKQEKGHQVLENDRCS